MARPTALILSVESRIILLRQQRVILDSDLADLYRVTAKRLNQQVKRNQERFPSDFMFQLTTEEFERLRLQFVTSNKRRGGRRYLPYAFTEHGAIMAATVINSARAVQMSVFVVRAFVRLRELLAGNRRLAAKIEELERRVDKHDSSLQTLIGAIKQLMEPQQGTRRRLGFQVPEKRTPQARLA
jgi:hypothetical protein